MRFVALLGILASHLGVGCKPSDPAPSVPSREADAMRGMRMQMLTTPPSDAGIQPTDAYPRVYGVLMDWHLGDQISTVVSMCDGHASLYTTATFGIIGGVGHESVRTAATAFVRAAHAHYDDAVPATEYPYPSPGHTLFYLLGFDGVRVIVAKTDTFARDAGGPSDLFAAGQRVITELRMVSGRKDEER